MRKEIRPQGIIVSGIYSGLVDSHFHAGGHGHETSAYYLKEQDMAETLYYIIWQPAHVVIDELIIYPLTQEYYTKNRVLVRLFTPYLQCHRGVGEFECINS